MSNLAHKWVESCGKTIAEAIEEYDGRCIEFAGALLEAGGCGRLAYFDCPNHPKWRYHAAAEIGGRIHCLWHPEVLTTADFIEKLGGGSVDYPAEQDS